MTPETSKIVFDLILALVKRAIAPAIVDAGKNFFVQRRIERSVEDAVAKVVEPLGTFFSQERVADDRVERLVRWSVEHLRVLVEEPQRFFAGSLSGQKVFEQICAERAIPQTIVEDGLRDTYVLFGPRVVSLLCEIPPAVKAWEAEKWREDYRRLDEIAEQLARVIRAVDAVASRPVQVGDQMFSFLRKQQLQKLQLELDVSGLRPDRLLVCAFERIFVPPRMTSQDEDESSVFQIQLEPGEPMRSERAVVIGPPGSGKSTWLKWAQKLELESVDGELPIRVELRSLARDALPGVSEMIRRAIGVHLSDELEPAMVKSWREAGRIAWLIDGFDEVAAADRDRVLAWITDLSASAPKCRIIVTSRPLTTNHLERLVPPWRQWQIEPFDQEQIVDYIGRWYQHVPVVDDAQRSVDARALASAWSIDPAIAPLTGNPLLLSTLLLVHHMDGRLPAGRAKLYQRYVDGMLGLWDDRRQIAHMEPEAKRKVLTALAVHMLVEGVDELEEAKALELVGRL